MRANFHYLRLGYNLNTQREKMQHIAIIGGGPRGLSALEKLILAFSKVELSFCGKITVFERSTYLGAGQVYSPDQEDSNWLNISERALTIPKRKTLNFNDVIIDEFPSFHEWSNTSLDTVKSDVFPPRSKLGAYLIQRFNSIANPLLEAGILHIVKSEIIDVNWTGKQFNILSECQQKWVANNVALTIGHQSTHNSKEWCEWEKFANENSAVEIVDYPYPVSNINANMTFDKQKAVGIRGFGLAMIDTMRALTCARGGEFSASNADNCKLSYTPSGLEPNVIIPYSLDGLPMAPKPIDENVDNLFLPTKIERHRLSQLLIHAAQEGLDQTLAILLNEVSQISARVYKDLGVKAYRHSMSDIELKQLSLSWLTDFQAKNDVILSSDLSCYEIMSQFVSMAFNQAPISFDYCIGNVWRHCEPIMYKTLSFSNIKDEEMTKIIQKDEQMKRYAFGPPVKSIQQILALVDANILNLEFVINPDIELTDVGWQLTKEDNSTTVIKMINTVLDAPAIAKVNSPIVVNLIKQELVQLVDDDLGVLTTKDGCIVTKNQNVFVPLAVMGRLAKGTLLGVDAILECFNERAEFWADSVVNRLLATTPK